MPIRPTVTVVPHTHWDRAWYLPFQSFRADLVQIVDEVLVALENPALSFTLDGQSVVLEDYLEIRPDQETRLRELIAGGRIQVGPWYILPDEFLVSGEALVRNLLHGTARALSFGRSMSVGYVPDAFGHIGQLPQILLGFGLGSFVFYRGIDPHEQEHPIEFWWQGADGSRVLASWLPFGYADLDRPGYPERESYERQGAEGSAEPCNLEQGAEQLIAAAERLLARSTTGAVLVCNGNDHRGIQPEIAAMVRRANELRPDWKIALGGHEQHVAALRKRLHPALPVRQGELSFPYGELLRGVDSTRVYLKQANHRVQVLLERYAEPLDALERLLGAQTAGHDAHERRWQLLRHAWRTLLKNQPHDEICGCSVDQTHRENEHLFQIAQQMGERVVADSLRAIGRRITRSDDAISTLLLYNPLPWPREEVLRATVVLPRDQPLDDFFLVDAAGRNIPCAIRRRSRTSWIERDKVVPVTSHEVTLVTPELPPGGYTTCFVSSTPGIGTPAGTDLEVAERSARNRFFDLRFAVNGTLELRDRRTGLCCTGLHAFEDTGDCGDEYNYSPVPGEAAITSMNRDAKVALERHLPFAATFRVDQRLTIPCRLLQSRRRRSHQTRETNISSTFTVYAHTPRIDISTTLRNRSRDHRLRVLFPTPLDTDRVWVEQAFDVVERPISSPPPRGGVPPYPTHNQQSFVSVHTDQGGLAVFNRGLPEYQAMASATGTTVALTLLRAVGHLSRDDFSARPYHAGPAIETPEAQCLRDLGFDYAIFPYPGGRELPVEVPREACAYSHPPLVRCIDAWAVGSASHDLPADLAALHLEPAGLLLSAFKRAEDGRGLIVRIYNPTSTAIPARLTMGLDFGRVTRIRLDEARCEDQGIQTTGRTVSMVCASRRILSLRFEI